MNLNRVLAGNLVELESKLDAVLFGSTMKRHGRDEDGSLNGLGKAGLVGAGGIGVAGAYGAHRGIMRKYGPRNPDGSAPDLNPSGKMPANNPDGKMPSKNPAGKMPNLNRAHGPTREAYASAGKDALGAARRGGRYGKGVWGQLKKTKDYWKSARSGASSGLGESVGGAFKTTGGKLLRGLKGVNFGSAVLQGLQELNARLDEVRLR